MCNRREAIIMQVIDNKLITRKFIMSSYKKKGKGSVICQIFIKRINTSFNTIFHAIKMVYICRKERYTFQTNGKNFYVSYNIRIINLRFEKFRIKVFQVVCLTDHKFLIKLTYFFFQTCKVCKKHFANVYRLQRHMISHDESALLRRFKCVDCGKAFKFKHHLKVNFGFNLALH